MTWYITLKPKIGYLGNIKTELIWNYLMICPELKIKNNSSFTNTENFPWVMVVIVQADNNGNYSIQNSETQFETTNCIELICSDYEIEKFYFELANKIVNFLDWVIDQEF